MLELNLTFGFSIDVKTQCFYFSVFFSFRVPPVVLSIMYFFTYHLPASSFFSLVHYMEDLAVVANVVFLEEPYISLGLSICSYLWKISNERLSVDCNCSRFSSLNQPFHSNTVNPQYIMGSCCPCRFFKDAIPTIEPTIEPVAELPAFIDVNRFSHRC